MCSAPFYTLFILPALISNFLTPPPPPELCVCFSWNMAQVVSRQVSPWTSASRTSASAWHLSVWHLSALALVCLALVCSGTCPPGTCQVTKTSNYVVWHLSPWHLSGQNIYSPTYTCPPIFGMIYLIPTYIFKNCLFSGAQKPSNLHSAPSQEDNGQQARCKDPSCKSARWTSARWTSASRTA